MSCTNPKPAILIPGMNKAGRRIKFLRAQVGSYADLREKYGADYVEIPCGECESCIEQRVKSWAVRCCLEAAQYEDNCFLTLTYNNRCLPKGGLCKIDIFKFIKRLRNTFGAGIRYYGCGEYGTQTDRPHYHMILFGFWPQDAQLTTFNPYGGYYYVSKKLQDLWPYGFVSVGEVSYNSCAYVARYCQKKLKKELGVIGTPEFSFMSRRPGIGENYFREHMQSLIETDKIYFHLGDKFKVSSFRYFDKLIERVNPDKLKELKDQRIRNGEINVGSELLARNLLSVEHYLLFKDAEMGEKYNKLKRRIS